MSSIRRIFAITVAIVVKLSTAFMTSGKQSNKSESTAVTTMHGMDMKLVSIKYEENEIYCLVLFRIKNFTVL